MRARNPVDTCHKKTSGVLKKWNVAIGSVEPAPGDVLARVRRGKRVFGARTEDKLLLSSVRGVLVAVKILYSIHMCVRDTKVTWIQSQGLASAAIPILTNGWFLWSQSTSWASWKWKSVWNCARNFAFVVNDFTSWTLSTSWCFEVRSDLNYSTSREGKDCRSNGGGLDLEFETLKRTWVSKYWSSFALGKWSRRRWCHGRAGRGECVAFSFGISPQPGTRVAPCVWPKCACHLRAWFWQCCFGGAAVSHAGCGSMLNEI